MNYFQKWAMINRTIAIPRKIVQFDQISMIMYMHKIHWLHKACCAINTIKNGQIWMWNSTKNVHEQYKPRYIMSIKFSALKNKESFSTSFFQIRIVRLKTVGRAQILCTVQTRSQLFWIRHWFSIRNNDWFDLQFNKFPFSLNQQCAVISSQF